MLEEFTLRLIRAGVLLLLQLQLSLYRRNRFRRAGSSGLNPGSRQDEATENHGHRDQSNGGDPRDLDGRALHRRPHVCLQKRSDIIALIDIKRKRKTPILSSSLTDPARRAIDIRKKEMFVRQRERSFMYLIKRYYFTVHVANDLFYLYILSCAVLRTTWRGKYQWRINKILRSIKVYLSNGSFRTIKN